MPSAPPEDTNASFPRFGLHDLLSAEERARDRRFRATAWLVGAAAVLLFLAAPSERLFDAGPAFVEAASSGPLAAAVARFGLPALAARLLHGLLGGSPERAAFLVSALAAGAAFPTTATLARRAGASWPASLLTAALCLTAPGPLLAATTPGPAAATLLGATILATALLPLPRPGDTARVFAGLGSALLLSPPLAVLAPCVVLAFNESPRARALRLAVPLAALVAGLALLARATLLAHSLEAFDVAPLGWSWLATPAALGPAGLALLALGRRPARAEESPPPVWILAWASLALPLGPPSLELAAAATPIAAVAVLYAADRLERRVLALSLLLVLQAASGASSRAATEARDPDRAWRAAARARLDPSTHLVTAHPRHAHEARARWGLATDLVPPAELGLRAAAAGPDELVDPMLADGSSVSARVVPDWVRLDASPSD